MDEGVEAHSSPGIQTCGTDSVCEADSVQTEQQEPKCETLNDLLGSMNVQLANFCLCIREQHLLPSVVQQQITSSMQHFVTSALTDCAHIVGNQLQRNGLLEGTVEETLNVSMHLQD